MKTKPIIFYFLTVLILVCAGISAKATVYYFSTSGSDGNSGTSTASPWQTISKLNAFWKDNALPGDQFLLKRGDIFYGTILPGRSGTQTNPIVLGTYGTGAQPLIKGFSTMLGWTLVPGTSGVNAIYESAANSEMQTNRLVTVVMTPTGGTTKQYAMGRTPNAAPRKWDLNDGGGYLKYTTRSTQDNGMALRWIKEANTSSKNWTGAEVVIKTARWLIGWWPIVSHSGGTISYYYDIPNSKENFGYFFQNDSTTLDVLGEWYYNKATKKLRMFFGSASPSSYTVEAASLSSLLTSDSKNWITIDNISFRGSNGHLILLNRGEGVVIKNCNMQFAGIDNLRTDNMKNVIVDNNVVTDACNNNMWVHGTGSIIKNNSVRNSYVFPGMGGIGDGHGYGIRGSAGATIEYNRIVNAGYAGIVHGFDNSVTRYNFIDSIALTKDDCGGIYAGATAKQYQARQFIGIKTYNNIILHAIGNSDGTNSISRGSSAYPIYQDDNMNNNEIYNNFFAFGNGHGMFLHNNSHQHVHHNIFYGNMQGSALIKDDGLNERGRNTSALNFHDNFYIQNHQTANTGYAEVGMDLVHEYSNVMGFGNWTNQVYARPVNTNSAVRTELGYPSPSTVNYRTLAAWKTYSNKDAGSVEAWAGLGNTNIISFYNDTKVNKTFNFSGTYKNARNVSYTNSITLAPFFSEVLIRTSGGGPTPNVAPTVSITGPANGTNYTSPATIQLSADALDSDGTVASVKFYQGNTLLHTDATSPYSYSWTNVANGTYQVRADATDDDVAITASTSITVNVTSSTNISPTVSITAPTNNATYTAPATIVLSASPADADGTISKVEFYSGDVLLGTDNTGPVYTFTMNGVPAGSYSLTAKATDNNSAVTTSSIIVVTVSGAGNLAPLVSLTSPVHNTTLPAPATINLSATASDPDGTIVRVDFFYTSNNVTAFLFTETTLPYSKDWVNVIPGIYSIVAKAYDNNNAVTTSSAATVTVTSTSSAPTSSILRPASNSNFAPGSNVQFESIATDSDGAITKVEFYHGGTTLFQTENNPPYLFSRSGWAAGSYVVTAKAFDNDGLTTTSAPVTFTITGSNLTPFIAFSSPSEAQVFTNPADIILSADATDTDGTIDSVQFYNGAILLNTDATLPYSYVWEDVGIGVYSMTAKAFDDDGGATITSPMIINVANWLPEDSITSPLMNAVFDQAQDSIVIEAGAFDINGTITALDFYNGSIKLGTDSTAPYTFTWYNIPVGAYVLSVVATDNDGGATQSGQVLITVQGLRKVRLYNIRLKP